MGEEAQKSLQEKDEETEKLKKDVAEKDAELAKNKSVLVQLKKIGRNFREKAAGGQPEQGEEPPRAVVTPRQDQPQASTSGPSAANLSNAPSTSGASGHGGASPSTPTTASVPPTLKRPRDTTAPDSDSQSSAEERAGPGSGYQKKARTISSTEFLQVSSGGAEVVEMGGVSGSQES